MPSRPAGRSGRKASSSHPSTPGAFARSRISMSIGPGSSWRSIGSGRSSVAPEHHVRKSEFAKGGDLGKVEDVTQAKAAHIHEGDELGERIAVLEALLDRDLRDHELRLVEQPGCAFDHVMLESLDVHLQTERTPPPPLRQTGVERGDGYFPLLETLGGRRRNAWKHRAEDQALAIDLDRG